MADVFKPLAQTNNVPAALTTVYTVPALKVTAVVSWDLINTTAAAILVTVKLGGITHLPNYLLPGGSKYSSEGKPRGLTATQTVQVSASAVGVDFQASGVETDV